MDNKVMAKQTTLSTNIDSELKAALTLFCKQRGLKIQSVVEDAIREQLEDEIDLATYQERRDEKEISMKDVLKQLTRNK
jgi:antitoxin component of RelBE/YafQ-DinJ toxin-antitoxin module